MSKYSTRDLKISIKNNAIDRVIENLSIRVVTTKTLSSVPNQAVIEIFQLYQHSREELYNNVYDFDENIGVTKIEVTLDEKVLFQGDLINVNSIYSKQDTEWKTILNCGDGYNAYRSTTSKKYDKGTDRESIVDDLIGELESTGVVVKGAVEGLTNCTKKSLLKAILVPNPRIFIVFISIDDLILKTQFFHAINFFSVFCGITTISKYIQLYKVFRISFS